MEYACGGCDPNWNVQKVVNNTKLNKQYYDKDMEVFYRGRKMDDVLSEIDWKCIICYDFKVRGKVKKTLSGRYRFIAERYEYSKDKICCEN
jgi:hypothetical protein